jgi:hypothetical protein
MFILLLISIFVAGCSEKTQLDESENYEQYLYNQQNTDNELENQFESFDITVNVCKIDPENADYWQETPINLFEAPGSFNIVTTIPSCVDARVKVVDTSVYNGVEMYKVLYNGKQGWQTKRLLTGEE